MKLEQALIAINGLAKSAQATTAIRPGVAFKDLTPEEQAQRRAEYDEHRRQNGRNIAAGKAKGNEPSWWDNTKAFAKGFGQDLAENGAANIWSGTQSALLGAAKGIASLPGDTVGIANGVWSKLRGGSFGEGYESGKNGINDLLGVTSLNNAIDRRQQDVMNQYTERNGIDPTDENDTLGRLGMQGLNIAHGAGRMVGEFKSPGLYGKAFKAIPTALKAVNNPVKALGAARRGIPQAMRAAKRTRQVTNGILKDPTARTNFISRFDRLGAKKMQQAYKGAFKDKSALKSVYNQAVKKNQIAQLGGGLKGRMAYHANGLLWKAPLAYGFSRMGALDDQGNNIIDNNVENANFWKGVHGNQPSYQTTAVNQMANGQTSPSTSVSSMAPSYFDEGDDLAYYINQ